jgi:hypothetical protein
MAGKGGGGVPTVDARPIIAARGEPFETIMAAVVALGDSEKLVLLGPFEPVPSEGVLGPQGFSCGTADLGGGDSRGTFRGGS